MLKIWRSSHSVFGHSPEAENVLEAETFTADAVYTDEELAAIAAGGFNGIWVHGLLHNLVAHRLLPEFGLYAKQQQEKLRSLITRAARYGIKIYLCCQPPRAISEENTAFWQAHGDLAGAHYPLNSRDWEAKSQKEVVDFICLCTSLPAVRQYISEAFAMLSAALPDLGGYILITASEFPAHCISHVHDNECSECPRCSQRNPDEIISELINCIAKGVHASAPQQEIIVWEWGWEYASGANAENIIKRLDKSVIIMGSSDQGALKIDGTPINEYAFCVGTPSADFLHTMSIARENGLRTFSKLQLNVTHEIATVPNLSVPGQLFERAQWVKNTSGCAGYMGCWNFGNLITCNTAAFHFFTSTECPDERIAALEKFAERWFPGCEAMKIRIGWEIFAKAIELYPHCIPWLYHGPSNWALGYFAPEGRLDAPCGRSWRPEIKRGDDLSTAIPISSIYQVDTLIGRYDAMVALLEEGLRHFDAGMTVPSQHTLEEKATAHTMYACFRSTRNLLKIYKEKSTRGSCSGAIYRNIMADEFDNVSAVLPFVASDMRQGFHSEAQEYMFSADTISQKKRVLQEVLDSHLGRSSLGKKCPVLISEN